MALALLGPSLLLAQAPPATPLQPARDVELFPTNATGETVVPLADYWDGVDNNNDLRFRTQSFQVLNDAGRMAHTSFPPFANFVDMNNDGLMDLVVADGFGFLWIFFNAGTKGKPAFTNATMIPTFLGAAAKIHVTDWSNKGKQDIVLGSFYGDITVLENIGTPSQPSFTRDMGIPRYVSPYYSVKPSTTQLPQIMLGKKPMVLGVYMSPWVVDWNKDGKLDLLFGEGTYSANSVRIAFNQGALGRAVFLEDRIFYLAYGEGFEQLTPSLLDYNGDGIPDLMCGTRTGHIRLYKGTTKSAEATDLMTTFRGTKAPATLEFDRLLPIGGKDVFTTMSSPYPCDWNDDGLFDILLGSTDGRLYIALNKGTAKEPAFPTATPIKGVNVTTNLVAPANWWDGTGRVNFPHIFGRLETEGDACNAATCLSAEKSLVLKPLHPPILPVAGERFLYFRYRNDYPGWTFDPSSGQIGLRGARTIGCRSTLPMTIGRRYEFSFSYILLGGAARCKLVGWEHFPATELRPSWSEERLAFEGSLTPAAGWQKKTVTITCPGKQKDQRLNFHLGYRLPAGDCQFFLDDFSLKELR